MRLTQYLKEQTTFENLRSTAFMILAALTLRWGVAEAYIIPSGSMEPTLQVNDRIFVNKLIYGIRWPFSKSWIVKFQNPRRGEIVVFKYPKDESIFFIKRIIGLPGDLVSANNSGEIFVNGQPLNESNHEIKFLKQVTAREFGPIQVPDGQLFVMGDNRDNSNDSRFWGFVPEENILGKAAFIWMGPIK